jgi:hypothetical protein
MPSTLESILFSSLPFGSKLGSAWALGRLAALVAGILGRDRRCLYRFESHEKATASAIMTSAISIPF